MFRLILFPLLVFGLFCGCTVVPLQTTARPGLSLSQLPALPTNTGRIAVSPDGSLLALSRPEGIYLRQTNGEMLTRLAPGSSEALAFSKDGSLVAAALPGDGKIVLWAVPAGTTVAELLYSGLCEAILPTSDGWLLFVTRMETYRFGAHLSSRMFVWNGRDPAAETLLNDATLDRGSFPPGEVPRTLAPQLSPYGDELLFLRLHDPPAFPPYRKVVLRRFDSSAETLVTTLDGLGGGARYLDHGDRLLVGDRRRLQRLDPWQKSSEEWQDPGSPLLTDPAGECIVVDQTLRSRNGQRLATLHPEVEAVAFLDNGRLFLRAGRRLWLLQGLPAVAALPAAAEEQRLRRWRAEELISPAEYERRR